MATKKPAPKKASAKKTKAPTLYLEAGARAEIAEAYEGADEALKVYFSPGDKAPAAAMALAKKVQKTLEGVLHATDVDCPYYACVLTGAELLDDEAFFGAMGIAQDAEATVGGYEYPKLETLAGREAGAPDDETTYDTLQLLTKLGDDELDSLDEYVEPDEQKAYKKAGKALEAIGTVVGGHLCAEDGASKLVFALARHEAETWVGLLTVRVET